MTIAVPKCAPTRVPLLARLDWERTFSDFENVFDDPGWSFGPWAISLHLNGPEKSDGFDFPALPEGSSLFRFTHDSGGDALKTLGQWDWQVWAVHSSLKNRVVEVGTFDLVLGFLEASELGTSTHASRMLALIEARLEGRLGLDAESYSIGGRSLSRIPIEELLALRTRYRVDRNAEVRRAEAGVRPGRRRTIRVSF